ncbi:hypothetical protein F2Q68_00041996 [Brassica cretica]|uniref:C2 tensin-type domain-containing protein n=1 Tax=Brassica cretica TaxID=69181 RepID=A0A8S9MA24_BRACR|nr:hypothetical protein F2Q68_00041996 [Brassica cretica]
MALFRKFFYKKPPEGLVEISERVYVFDCCLTTDMLEEEEYRVYVGRIMSQLREQFPGASFMVFNFRDGGESTSLMESVLSEHDMTTIMDYPRHYEGCPLLTMETVHHFLKSSENWLLLSQQNILLAHCERGGWPVLAFMLASLLLYRKQFSGEEKTLEMMYKYAPRELLQLMSPLNPLPSQLRFLRYVSSRSVGSQWPPLDRAVTLDCIILKLVPDFDGEGGCRPIFRIYGQDPFMASDRTSKVLFSMPKRSKAVKHYKQADCEVVKIDINCHILGDVVLECITLDSDHEREEMMFRVVFNTAFLRSNALLLNRDDVDVLWNTTDRFPKGFRAEVIFSEMGAGNNHVSVDLPDMEENDGLPMEAFAKVQEIFSDGEWLDPNSDVAVTVFNQITAANILQESLDSGSPRSPDSRSLIESALEKVREKTKLMISENVAVSPDAFSPVWKERDTDSCHRSYADPNSLIKKVDEPHGLRVSVQRQAHSKIISPRLTSPVLNRSLTQASSPASIQLKYLAEEMQAIRKGLEKVVQEFTTSETDGPVSKHFRMNLKEFLSLAEGEVRSLASLYSTVGGSADALALYFGEDPARVPFEQVVSTLQNFVRIFVRSHEENCKQVEFEKRRVQKETENDKLKKGGASGIGAEAARLFTDQGAKVVIVDIQEELGRNVAVSIGKERASFYRCDITEETQVENAVKFTVEKHGKLDVLFSNAGILDPRGSILDLDLDRFDRIMAVNVRGAAAFIKHAAGAMVEKGTRGSIVCTTSVSSEIGGGRRHGYTASKHGLLGLIRTACGELGKYGIRVNGVAPYALATPLTSHDEETARQVEEEFAAKGVLKGVVLNARHVAQVALFLASDESVYVSGQNLAVDGGYSMCRSVNVQI